MRKERQKLKPNFRPLRDYSRFLPGAARDPQPPRERVHDNLIQFLRLRQEAFPFRRDIDVRHFLADAVGVSSTQKLPVPAKIFLVDELVPKSYGFPLSKAPLVDELEQKLGRWLNEEVNVHFGEATMRSRAEDLLGQYREQVVKLAKNAADSSILADYHSVFWLLHSQQVAKLLAGLVRNTLDRRGTREDADRLKYALREKWAAAIRAAVPAPAGFLELLLENPLIAAEEFVGPDLRELRGYFAHMRREYTTFRRAFDDLRTQAQDLASKDKLLRRALTLLGYPDTILPAIAILDPRVRQLLADHSSYRAVQDQSLIEALSRRALELFIVQALRRSIVWMKTTEDGDNVADDAGSEAVYSRAIRPMNFGRRGVVEPIVYRYGLVYDITSFTETLGEIARGGKVEEQSSYRQMLEFQRELAEITRRHGLQFEKFLGDGAFYTSRRATRVVQAAVEIQRFYSKVRATGFAFNKGMRIALNYGYYRLLPMQVSADGTQIIEFYGPGIVELSRLTTGKTTKEIEDIQHLLLTHGYDQNDVYRFFSPLARSVDHTDSLQQQREFYAYVNESGHLINEGIVVSIPFLRQLSTELAEDAQKIYRLRTPWSVYLGVSATEQGGYVGIRLLGSVSLKGIGQQEIGELVWLTPDLAEISMLDDPKPLLQALQLERNRSAARNVGDAAFSASDVDIGTSDLVVAQTQSVILVGEWDPVSEEVRRPIRLDGTDAERYGLAMPLTIQSVESQTMAYQKLYRKLSRIETLPTFSVDALRDNQNFSGFIIGATVEPL